MARTFSPLKGPADYHDQGCRWFYKRRAKLERKGTPKKKDKEINPETERLTAPDSNKKKTQKNRAINPKKNRANKTQPKKENTEKNRNINPDFVPARNQFSSKQIYPEKERGRGSRINPVFVPARN